MGMPESVDGKAGEQVQVAPAVGVPDGATLTPDEDPLGRPERVHHRVLVRLSTGAEPERAEVGQLVLSTAVSDVM